MAVTRALKQFLLTSLCCFSLTGCGFVTTPLALASAEVASSTVKAADYGLYQGRQAANYLRDQGTAGTEVTVEFLGSVVDSLDTVLRSDKDSAP